MLDLEKALGIYVAPASQSDEDRRKLVWSIHLQLATLGLPTPVEDDEQRFFHVAHGLLDRYQTQRRMLGDHRCPADSRIEDYLGRHLADSGMAERPRLPGTTFDLVSYGMARELSLPTDGDAFISPLVRSYRVKNGVLHNPASDRRTTAGTFHVAEGGLPIPWDKKAVPKRVFAELLHRAISPPEEMLILPFTANMPAPAHAWVSLLLRPVVCPEVPGYCPEKSMEVRFFAPGSLVSNLDFVESIFGNGGDPQLAENDAGLDVEHWSGHTGCVILAPHLSRCTKKELGLPPWEQASERQRRDGMCWKDRNELYNEGSAFKITCRTHEGVIVTLIADNYFGYCKKEVKTQISYAANLMGNVEEEHAGGAIAYASYSIGEEFDGANRRYNDRTFEDVARDYAGFIDVRPEGYGVDRKFPELIYVREDVHISIPGRKVTWKKDGIDRELPLYPGKVYMTPCGYKVRMEKHPGAPSWRLVGVMGEGVFCHKPCTVSGGGKSEISKSLVDYMLYGPIFVSDMEKDIDLVDQVFNRDFSTRWKPGSKEKPDYSKRSSRPVLSPERSLGSVIKLLTPSPEYKDPYNAWLKSVPNYIWPIIFVIKRFASPDWGDNWREHFSVDIVNGVPGHELKYQGRKLVGTYLRVGFRDNKAWRTYKARQDFIAAAKVQTEDDITASVVVPKRFLENLHESELDGVSVKFVTNCEYRLFQRPDDAVVRGLDRQTETDLAQGANFISNFEPLTREQVRQMAAYATELEEFTPVMRDFLRSFAEGGGRYIVSSAQPRMVDGKPSKNPRYLQIRPDVAKPFDRYLAERGVRLFRAIPPEKPVHIPVVAVLTGRRNNPPEPGIRPLAVYNPIHYQELPELFMEFVCSLTGKSPSTTGVGSEGALTKGPFNAVRTTADLNTALVSFILTGLGGFSTAAGYVGPRIKVEHDISLLVPELWCRLTAQEQNPRWLIENGLLERLADFDHKGERILASRLGWRMTYKFVQMFFGRIFDNPGMVLEEEMLKPEKQDLDAFVDGIKNITEAQQRVARGYFDDGSIEEACPPLQALLEIMANGSWQGKDAGHPDVRNMFTRESLLASEWYRRRLATRQKRDIRLWQRHVAYLEQVMDDSRYTADASAMKLTQRRIYAAQQLERVQNADYLAELVGTLGADPMGEML